jgi:hypothetical protein
MVKEAAAAGTYTLLTTESAFIALGGLNTKKIQMFRCVLFYEIKKKKLSRNLFLSINIRRSSLDR